MRKRKIYLKNDHKLIAVLAILMCCQIGFTAYETHQQYLNQKKSVATLAIQKQATEDERAYSGILNLAATIYADSDVLTFLGRQTNGMEEHSQIGYLLRRYATIAGEINNIYIYSDKQKILYDMYLHRYQPDSGRHPSLFSELEKEPEERTQEMLHTERSEGQAMNVCYIFTPDKLSRDAVIIELETNDLFSRYADTQLESGGALVVVQEDGDVIYGGGEFSFGENIFNEKFFLEKNSDSKLYLGEHNNRKMIFNYHSSELLNRWYVSLIVNHNAIGKQIFNTQFIYLYIGLLITLLALLRVSSWIRMVRQKIETRKLESELKIKEEEQKYAFRNMLLDYAHESKSESGLNKMVGILQPSFQMDKKFGILLIKINRYAEFRQMNKPSVMELYRYGMKNIITELLTEAGFGVFDLLGRDNHLEFLIGNYSGELTTQTLKEICKSIREAIEGYIEVTTSYLYSDCFPLKEIGGALRQAERIRSYSILYEDGAILGSEVLKTGSEAAFSEAVSLIQKLNQAITKGTGQEKELFDEFVTMLYYLSAEQAKEALWRLIFTLNDLQEQFRQQDGLLSDYGDNLMPKIESAESIGEIRSIVEYYLKKFTTQRQNRSNNRLQTIVNTCCDIIEQEYSNESLCIEIIAERVGLSVNYLGRNFRQMTGESITDRILHKRLQIAEKMLLETDMEINTIMKSSGFSSNASYFSKLFKKYYGTTPTQYRQEQKNQ